MWRVVGVRVGLPRHDMEVEGVVVKDDAILCAMTEEGDQGQCSGKGPLCLSTWHN